MTNPPTFAWHDDTHIRRLQRAHADHIESIYRGLAQLPGNPDGVQIRAFGDTRTFLAHGERFTNRVILTGNETLADLDTIFAYYDQNQAGCVIELNPANFYPTAPFAWESDRVPALLQRGCELRHFRCVWQRDLAAEPAQPAGDLQLASYPPAAIDRYIEAAQSAEPEQDWTEQAPYLRQTEGQAGWYHYIALKNGAPIATASLFQTGSVGYLAEAYTHPQHRRQGAHSALIAERVRHARELGCQGVFTVTDSYTQSARDLQRSGFSLAYNYLLFVRSPAGQVE